MFHAPLNIIKNFEGNVKAKYTDNEVVIELRGNPYPKLMYSNTKPNKKTIHNVLLAEAAKDYNLNMKYKIIHGGTTVLRESLLV